MKNTINTLLKMKSDKEKISMVTSYDYSMSVLANRAGINTILVGDSLGMTMQGYENTIPVTMEEMIIYGRSVKRGSDSAFVIMDMPFMSYQVSVEQALTNAGRLIKETGANAVKLEGGAAVAKQIKAIVDAGIPVCAHIGMTPQSANAMGGFKVQGKDEAKARSILEDALEVQKAGAFMVVLECIPPKLAALITKKLDIITIGIGAGSNCDGQVLVCQDMLGISQGFQPKFAKHYADLGQVIIDAYKEYDQEVKSSVFPAAEHEYCNGDCSDEFLAELDKEYE